VPIARIRQKKNTRQAMCLTRNSAARLHYHCCSAEAIIINECYVCVLALLINIQIASLCACAILSSVACPALKFFPTLSPKRSGFRENVTKHKMCVLNFSTFLFETFLILRIIRRHVIINIHISVGLHVKYRHSSQILKGHEFSG
jgi:hypothetical protein